MARKDASKPPIDKYRKEIGKHDKKKGDKINKAEKRQREADAAAGLYRQEQEGGGGFAEDCEESVVVAVIDDVRV